MDRSRDQSFLSIRMFVTAGPIACLLAFVPTPAGAQTGAIMIPIEKMTVGAAPADLRVALWTKSDSVTRIDQFNIQVLP